jgi:hypothetical protein
MRMRHQLRPFLRCIHLLGLRQTTIIYATHSSVLQ